MFTVVYVLIDNENLKFYNELMISLKSLKKYMPEQPVCILVDNNTFSILQNKKGAEDAIFKWAYLKIIDIPPTYTQKEKSRFLKTTLRNQIDGDILFLDTDTVICCAFSHFISSANIAMVLDGNLLISERLNPKSVFDLQEYCGLPLKETNHYFNSGVIWIKDNEITRNFYCEWHQLWEVTRKSGHSIDQPSLNFINQKNGNLIEQLDMAWNVQVSVNPCPIKYISEAIIIHYYNVAESPYILCDEKIKKLGYNSNLINNIIENPKKAFYPCNLTKTDYKKDMVSDSRQFYFISELNNKYHFLFEFNEFVLRSCGKIKRMLKKLIKHK